MLFIKWYNLVNHSLQIVGSLIITSEHIRRDIFFLVLIWKIRTRKKTPYLDTFHTEFFFLRGDCKSRALWNTSFYLLCFCFLLNIYFRQNIGNDNLTNIWQNMIYVWRNTYMTWINDKKSGFPLINFSLTLSINLRQSFSNFKN